MRVKVLIDWLVHDGQPRQPGEVLDLEPAAAAQLRAVGAVEPVEPVTVTIPAEELTPPTDRRRRRS